MVALLVGQRVRVEPSAADALSRRALLLAEDGDAFELEYECGDCEEAVVSVARLSALLPFEESAALAADPSEGAVAQAERLKAQGNALFKLRDATAALGQYVAALKVLQADAPLRSARSSWRTPTCRSPRR